MSYEKTTWASGDVITAAKLNKIEDGVAAASKIVPVVTVINNSTRPFYTTGEYDIRGGVLWAHTISDLAVPANTTTYVTRVAFDDTLIPVPAIKVDLDGDHACIVTSDTMNVAWVSGKAGTGHWACTVEDAPIPEDMTIIISDPPIGEERTVAIQAGNQYISNLPESVTGRVNDYVSISGVAVADHVNGVSLFYDESTQLGAPWEYEVSGLDISNFTITFRMPSTDYVSDTGYIKIFGSR